MTVFASAMHRFVPTTPRPALRGLTAAALACCALLSACVLRPPQSSEETMVDSVIPGDAVGAGITGKPFCLHLRYRNHFFSAYSDSRVEAWVTDGSCTPPPPVAATSPASAAVASTALAPAKRQVGTLRIGWWYDWEDHQKNRQCMATDHCEVDAQNVILGRHIRCAVAQVADGPYTAFVTTDITVCH
jgi:hypothetical protein